MGDSVRISFAVFSTHPLVATLARHVRAERPGIELELSSQNFAQPALQKLATRESDIALGRWDNVPDGLDTRVVMADALVLAVPATHSLAEADEAHFAQLLGERFVSLPAHEGSVLDDRLRRLAQAQGYAPHVAQVAPDTQTALALVSAEVGCLLTMASVAATQSDPHVRFIPVATGEVGELPTSTCEPRGGGTSTARQWVSSSTSCSTSTRWPSPRRCDGEAEPPSWTRD